jgi:rhodanese-related sulfurtransferase
LSGDEPLRVLDVRGSGEHGEARVPGAVNLPLPGLPERLGPGGDLDPTVPLAVICKTGYRSSAAASLLLRAGFANITNVVGGTDAWLEAGFDAESDVADAACSG